MVMFELLDGGKCVGTGFESNLANVHLTTRVWEGIVIHSHWMNPIDLAELGNTLIGSPWKAIFGEVLKRDDIRVE